MCSHTKYRGNNRMSISLQVSWTTLKSTIPASISKHFLFCSFKREMFSFTIFVLALRINLYISNIHDKVSALFFLLFPRLLFWQNALEWFCTNHDGIFFHTVLYKFDEWNEAIPLISLFRTSLPHADRTSVTNINIQQFTLFIILCVVI